MTFHITSTLALCRQIPVEQKSLTLTGILIHWILVYYYLVGFYQGSSSMGFSALFTIIVLLASWCYGMACLSDPGHIDYEIQDGFSDDKLNNRLYDQMTGKKVMEYDIMHDHTETELVEQDSIVETEELDSSYHSLDVIRDGEISNGTKVQP
jgi:hypothetical protein